MSTEWEEEEIWAPLAGEWEGEMTKKENEMEGLTDDVLALICELAIPAGDYVGFRREDAKCLIARILKAVVDGMPLPDEAGRAVWAKQGDEDHIYDWVADVIGNGARTFIALRPEGTGKEEEPSFIAEIH